MIGFTIRGGGGGGGRGGEEEEEEISFNLYRCILRVDAQPFHLIHSRFYLEENILKMQEKIW